jgi:hypothetical protein
MQIADISLGRRAPTLHRRVHVRAKAVSQAHLNVLVVVVKFAPDDEIQHRRMAGPSILATIPALCRWFRPTPLRAGADDGLGGAAPSARPQGAFA